MLFVQAKAEVPGPAALSNPSEFNVTLTPFASQAFATNIGLSDAGIGPLAIVVSSDGTVIASGGANRGWLYKFDATGGRAVAPFAMLDEAIFDLAYDKQGQLWAATGGGALLLLNPDSGAILARFGDSITQALAVDPASGLLYVSSGNGVETFDPVTHLFNHFSDLRVDDLAFSPQGVLWGTVWPNRGDIVTFDNQGRAQRVLTLDSKVDSIAFGAVGTQFEGLLFVSNNVDPTKSGGASLVAIDLATREHLEIATGGAHGETLTVMADGRILIAQTDQIDVLSPLIAPQIIASNPLNGDVIPLPLAVITVTFDHDMLATTATDPSSVLNPANFALFNSAGEEVPLLGLTYDAATRTASLRYDPIGADQFNLRVSTNLKSEQGLAIAQIYSSTFSTLLDISNQIAITFTDSRSDRGDGTVSYDVIVTNVGEDDLRAPVTLILDPAAYFQGTPGGGAVATSDGVWVIDLTPQLGTTGVLKAGESSHAQTVTVSILVSTSVRRSATGPMRCLIRTLRRLSRAKPARSHSPKKNTPIRSTLTIRTAVSSAMR